MMSTTIFFILLCALCVMINISLAHRNSPSASSVVAVASADATCSVAPTALFNTSNNNNKAALSVVQTLSVSPVDGGLIATAMTTEATENNNNSSSNDDDNDNSDNNKFAAHPVVEGKSERSSSNKKLEVTLKHVRSDGTITLIPVGNLDEIPQVRRVLTRAPKGRIMMRHPTDPTTTWSVSEDDLYDWLWESGLQWKHDYDFIDNDGEQDENNNSDNNDNNSAQQQEPESTAVHDDAPLALKDAIHASISDAVDQLVALLWWTAALAFLALCVWIVAMALTLDMEANYRHQQNQRHREQEMLRVATLHAATLRQTGQRPFFLCPQQWEERCLDEAMKTLYNVSYFNTRHYHDRNNNNNISCKNNSEPMHCYGYPQPRTSQIYRHCY